VSNAGIFHTAPFDELTADEWRRMLRVHLDGAFHLAQPADAYTIPGSIFDEVAQVCDRLGIGT
jgi:NAD(P)-dependent dehydrogenase (short-subunit alcohol dehydrogenase family)